VSFLSQPEAFSTKPDAAASAWSTWQNYYEPVFPYRPYTPSASLPRQQRVPSKGTGHRLSRFGERLLIDLWLTEGKARDDVR